MCSEHVIRSQWCARGDRSKGCVVTPVPPEQTFLSFEVKASAVAAASVVVVVAVAVVVVASVAVVVV